MYKFKIKCGHFESDSKNMSQLCPKQVVTGPCLPLCTNSSSFNGPYKSGTCFCKLCICTNNRGLTCICGWHSELCWETMVSRGVPEYMQVISMTLMFLMSSRWVYWWSHDSSTDFHFCPLDTDFFRFSQSFDDGILLSGKISECWSSICGCSVFQIVEFLFLLLCVF